MMKANIIKNLREKKVNAKDIKDVGIHKVVHEFYKVTKGDIRASAKSLVAQWKVQLKTEPAKVEEKKGN